MIIGYASQKYINKKQEYNTQELYLTNEASVKLRLIK